MIYFYLWHRHSLNTILYLSLEISFIVHFHSMVNMIRLQLCTSIPYIKCLAKIDYLLFCSIETSRKKNTPKLNSKSSFCSHIKYGRNGTFFKGLNDNISWFKWLCWIIFTLLSKWSRMTYKHIHSFLKIGKSIFFSLLFHILLMALFNENFLMFSSAFNWKCLLNCS